MVEFKETISELGVLGASAREISEPEMFPLVPRAHPTNTFVFFVSSR